MKDTANENQKTVNNPTNEHHERANLIHEPIRDFLLSFAVHPRAIREWSWKTLLRFSLSSFVRDSLCIKGANENGF